MTDAAAARVLIDAHFRIRPTPVTSARSASMFDEKYPLRWRATPLSTFIDFCFLR